MTDPRLPTVDEVRHNRDVVGASTSEQLRQAQAALAASQQDLSRAERDLSAVLADNQDLNGERDEMVEQKLALKAELRQALARCGELADRVFERACERDLARAELATATRELEQLRTLHAHCPTRERQ